MEYVICHHGIKGQKWGIRRYQNPDGTLTTEGKERYGKLKSIKEIDKFTKKLNENNTSLYWKSKISKEQYKENKKEIKDIKKRTLSENHKGLVKRESINTGIKAGATIAGTAYGKHVARNAVRMLGEAGANVDDLEPIRLEFNKGLNKMRTVSVAKTLMNGGINTLRIGIARQQTGNLKPDQKVAGETVAGAVQILGATAAIGSMYAPGAIKKIKDANANRMSSYERSQQKGSYGDYEEIDDEPYYLEDKY